MRFDDATALVAAADGSFDWEIGRDWRQGRGAYGGLVAAGAARAVVRSESDPDRVLRTLSLHLGAPLLPGPARIDVDPIRVGSGLSTWSVTISGEGGAVAAHAVAVTGRSRAPDLADAAAGWEMLSAPQLQPWRDVPAVPTRTPPFPVFAQHVEFRIIEGLPVSGGRPRSSGYVRFRDQRAWDAASLLAIVDAWWPAPMTALTSERPMVTSTYAAQILVDPATLPVGEPLGYEAFTAAAHEGYLSETRRLWSPDGRLAVENLQTVVAVR